MPFHSDGVLVSLTHIPFSKRKGITPQADLKLSPGEPFTDLIASGLAPITALRKSTAPRKMAGLLAFAMTSGAANPCSSSLIIMKTASL
jgi:hypothetical protein